MDDGIAAGKRRERLRPQQAMGIGNRANGSHHARPASKRSRGPLSHRAVLLVVIEVPHRGDTLLLYCWKNPLILGPAPAGLFFAARSRTTRHAPCSCGLDATDQSDEILFLPL